MDDGLPDEPTGDEDAPLPAHRWRPSRKLLILLGIAGAGLGGVWLARYNLADKVITGQLAQYDLPATYQLTAVGPRRQVLSNVVIGDPRRPDLTVERVEVLITPTFGMPTIGSVRLVRPRLYGKLVDGKPSFGSLDKVIYAEGGGTSGLPDLLLQLDDGRARIDSGAGPIGIKADGRGNLKSGFGGHLAAVAPNLTTGGCAFARTSLYGTIKTAGGAARFAGPMRLGALDCKAQGLALRNAGVQLDATLGKAFDTVSGKAGIETDAFAYAGESARRLVGGTTFTLRGGDLTATYKLGAVGTSGTLAARTLDLEGFLRTRDAFARIESEGTLAGSDVRVGTDLDATLAGLVGSAEGTLAAPLLEQTRRGLLREGAGSELAAGYTLRSTGDLLSLTVPRAVWRGASGADVVALSRLQVLSGGQTGLRLSGNVQTGGVGLPRLSGQIERQAGGAIQARFAMAEYRAGDAVLAVPEMLVVQRPGGELGFAGTVLATGAIPGGRIERMRIPLDGNWSSRSGLSVGRRCLPLQFDRITYASLQIDSRQLTVCPGSAGAIVRSGANGLLVSAGAPSLNVSGRLGGAPIRIANGPVGFAMPGALAAQRLDIALGNPAEPSRFRITNLTARVGKDIAGRFSGSDVTLAAVPLDILGAEGAWRYADGKLSLSDAAFRLEDRAVDDRFRPLVSTGATLLLADNRVTAKAALNEPTSGRLVTSVDIAHDLGSGRGHADLDVPGVLFDNAVQPDTLTYLALGVIANARGTVAGTGRIDWTPDRVTSTGRFRTDGLDFAAAFGPVQGVKGEVVFTDLLGLVTAPDQRLAIAEINPGIPVENGVLSFALQGDNVLQVNGATWPFLDGTLELLPTRMVLGVAETRRYTLRVSGLNAAKFVARMDLGNISATGIFDGDLPLVFDEEGGKIVGGMLVSRPPGGNVSYVGELTYKDLSAMGNFAFQTLRSLDYRRMQVGMDGMLDGELVTRVRLDGVRQGEGAKKNFITSRFDKLPIQFNINIRAPFQKLMGSFRTLYDPSFIPDPRTLGLVGKDGRASLTPQGKGIQPPVSRTMP